MDYGTVGKAAPQYRGQRKATQVAVLHVEHQEFLARLISPKDFFFYLYFLLNQNRQCLSSLTLFPRAAFGGRWHTGDESSCLHRCTSQPRHVCEFSGLVLTSDACWGRPQSDLGAHQGSTRDLKQRSGHRAGSSTINNHSKTTKKNLPTRKTLLNGLAAVTCVNLDPATSTGKGLSQIAATEPDPTLRYLTFHNEMVRRFWRHDNACKKKERRQIQEEQLSRGAKDFQST